MTPTPVKLPPNPIRHFYRGGPAIAELRGIDVGGDHSPEEWIGSASTLFGESERGLSRLPDGGLVRDALAADPEGWLGADHVARFGASPALLALPADRRPTALFTANNRNTVGALRALRDGDGTIALVGFDDFELADLLGITVVRHDSPQMGANAAALAFERLDGGGREPRRVVVPTELVVRGSGEVPPS